MKFDNTVEWLSHEYENRRRRNPNYSKRAFARQLGVSSGQLAGILSGRSLITKRTAESLAAKLHLSEERRTDFIELATKQSFLSKNLPRASRDTFDILDDDEFRSIAEWHHFAIVNLIDTEDFRSDIPWIAARIGIPEGQTREAIDRLIKLNIVEKEDDVIKLKKSSVATTTDLPSAAIRRHHEGVLEKGIDSLDTVDVSLRDFSSMAFPVDPTKIELAKKLIRDFRRNLADLLDAGERKEVYNLSIQLFPLTQR